MHLPKSLVVKRNVLGKTSKGANGKKYFKGEEGNRLIKNRSSNEVDETKPIIQSEVSQKEKHQYSILMHIYGI